MRVAITGASGLIGGALARHLEARGDEIVTLVRDRAQSTNRAAYWSVTDKVVDTDALAGVDAVVHLAGEPIASGRWNPAVKARIRDSRTQGTDVLARALASMTDQPSVLVSGSAIGFYGSRGDDVLDEASGAGHGFLPEVCVAWEQAAAPAAQAGIRVVHPRTGVVLSADGGALAKMRLPFKLGLGGRIGDGQQWFSWISLHDEVRALTHLLDGEMSGPVNLTGPAPVDNASFTEAMGRAVHRPTAIPLPAFAVRAALGEMGERLLLDSQRVVPKALLDDGFRFDHATVGEALAWALES
ncbi:MAG: hypothetical protein ACI867_000790 [Glaciecola sp.]|jgi:uncharacterized protein (TIGR01777 family)